MPLITIIAAMSPQPGRRRRRRRAGCSALYTVGAIVGLVLAGRFLLRPLFRLIGNLGEREMFVFAGLFTVIASAALMELLGLSTALGAFIAGVMLADTPYRHELEADVEPFRSILLGLFFLAVGMMLDLGAIAERPFFVVGMALALIAVKAAIIFGLARAFRMPWRPALGARPAAQPGRRVRLRPVRAGAERAADRAGGGQPVRRDRHPVDGDDAVPDDGDPAACAPSRSSEEEERDGPDRRTARTRSSSAMAASARRSAQMLLAQGIQVTLVDTDIEMIDVAGSFGAKVYYGDGTRLDLLRQAGAAEAELILFCLDGDQIEAELIEAVHAAFPEGEHLRARL